MLIPASTAYPQDRYYTPGGLLEVGGELADVGHTVQEWTTVGGSIALSTCTGTSCSRPTGDVIAQPGAIFNIAGGSVTYQAGMVPTTWLIGSNGQLYNVNTAPSDLTYIGVYDGITVAHPRWGITQTFENPLLAPATVYQAAYTVGRDAGTLTISAPSVVFEATIDAGVVAGAGQTTAQPATSADASLLLPNNSLDPFLLPNSTVPLPGDLVLSNVLGASLKASLFPTDVVLGNSTAPLAASLTQDTPLPSDRSDTALISASLLDSAGLGGLTIDTAGTVQIDSPLTLADGGKVSVVAAGTDVTAPLVARGGSVTLTGNDTAFKSNTAFLSGAITLDAAGLIDTRGVFTNLLLTPDDTADQAFAGGGSVTINSSEGVFLQAGSLIDASAGGTVLATGKTVGAAGGATLDCAGEGRAGG